MRKNIILSIFVMLIITAKAYADGMVFDPTEYKPAQEQAGKSDLAQKAVSENSTNFNNALFELDSAQVNIRNELLEQKAKYQEIDTQYQLIKEQRRVLGEQIKSVERRIKAIERSKENIRKTMI